MGAWLALQREIAEPFCDPKLTKGVWGPGKHCLMFEDAQHGPTWGSEEKGPGWCWTLQLVFEFKKINKFKLLS